MRKNLSLLVVMTSLVVNPQTVHAMFYRPVRVAGMGDQWLYYHDGIHYLYHLYEQPAGHLHGVYLATSTDGVNFTEVGPVIEKRQDATWLGSGAVWRAEDRYIMNFSEARAHQSIFFAESRDLRHWDRLGDEYRSDPDPRWYEVNRWDCIWALPRAEGGFWGYLSANPWRHSEQRPGGLTYRSTAMLESADGARWTAVSPPVFEWGDTPEMENLEVAAVREFHGTYYMLVQTWGPYTGGAYCGSTAPGVYTFVGDGPRGPFRPDTGAYRFLGNTDARHRSTHFPRFYETPDHVLANHFFFTRRFVAWLAPLKKVTVDAQGHLRLAYWAGNDAVKGKPLAVTATGLVSPSGLALDGANATATTLLANQFDLVQGLVLEGTLEVQPSGEQTGRCGVYLEEIAGQGTAVLLGTNGQTELGTLKIEDAPVFEPNDFVRTGIAARRKHTFRLLTRQYMIEFYLDDRLVQCYSIPERATGRIGFVAQGGLALVGNLNAWEMVFSGGEAGPSPDR